MEFKNYNELDEAILPIVRKTAEGIETREAALKKCSELGLVEMFNRTFDKHYDEWSHANFRNWLYNYMCMLWDDEVEYKGYEN